MNGLPRSCLQDSKIQKNILQRIMVLLIKGSMCCFQVVVNLLCMLLILSVTAGFSFSLGSNVANSKAIMCLDKERQALLNFKQDLEDTFNAFSSWGGKEEEDCCRWRGIGCDNRTGHVIMLNLQPIVMYGSHDTVAIMPISGEISSSLLELHSLSYLDLTTIAFDRIPSFLGSLNKLTYLSFFFFRPLISTIPFPPQLGNLSNLHSLHLYSFSPNFITVDNMEWLSHLSSLRILKMTNLNLSGAVDLLQSIKNLPSLSTLELFNCQLRQISIPSSPLSYVNSSKSLEVIDLSSNSLDSSIFSWLLNVSSSNLVDLRLSDNELQGPVPDSFGDFMPSLAHLNLSTNQLQGAIPKSLGNLFNLQTLDLSRNKLNGSLLDMTRFSSLRELHLDNNQLEGSLPKALGQLSKLAVLNVRRNRLVGPLPESVGQLSSLKVLDVSSNSLNAVISETHLSNLSELQQLGLSLNRFTLNFSSNWLPAFELDTLDLRSCKIGPRFPRWLRTQNSLSYLDISESGIVSDTIPDWFWNLTSKLLYLNLSFNHISGMVPNLPLKFDHFPAVDLSSNLFYGPIPPFLSIAAVLNLSKNRFSDSISFLCPTMEKYTNYLDLSDNLLSGGLPNCWMHWNRLDILNLENNKFSGEVPSSMGLLHMSIRSLRLRNNSFSGKLPLSLQNCTSLKVLDIGENQLSGKIPTWIGESLTGLIVLRLRSNNFSGHIPSNICHLTFIQVLDISLNNISGSIPTCVNNFTAMAQNRNSDVTISYSYIGFYEFIDAGGGWSGKDANYDDKVMVMWKGTEQEYGRTLGLLKLIDLSSNKLSGEIPEQVTTLFELITLNLSGNSLTGIIPTKIGQLKALQSLDLSRNRISGEIPPSLADLSYLGVLDLSNNDLSGKIPSGTQLQSFDASRYMGNPQLCGLPLLIRCPGDETLMQEHPPKTAGGGGGGDQWFGTLGSYVSMGLGFFVGFWGVCATLVLNSSWRIAYFQFLNDKWDWLYVEIAVNMAKLRRSWSRG